MNEIEVKAGLAEVNAFDVVGISVMTDNETGAEAINDLWERFFKDSIGQSVPNKENDVIYAVYSDYKGDHTEPYRFTIGYKVTSTDDIPEGMHHVSIFAQDYAVMSAAGKQPKALIEAWQAIWSGDLDRSFATDFEIYGPRFFEDGVNEVLIHVGITIKNEQESS